MFGAVSSGETEIHNLLDSEDNHSTRNAIRQLGAEVDVLENETHVRVRSGGLSQLRSPTEAVDCGNSGTTMRLFSGLLAGVGLTARLIGDQSLSGRPMARIVNPLRQMGFDAFAEGEGDRPPLQIAAGDHLPNGLTYESPVASAQVKSCVLLAGLRASGPVAVQEPAPSRDHTERMLRYFGYDITSSPNYECPDKKPARVELQPSQDGFQPRGRPIDVPGDISSAAFMMVAAVLTNSPNFVLERVSTNPTRTGVLEALELMGVNVLLSARQVLPGGEPVSDMSVRVNKGSLGPTTIGGALIPRLIDEIPVLAVLACMAEGETLIKDAAELRVKESDRIASTVRLLTAAGVDVTEREDGFSVFGPSNIRAFSFDAGNDHRLAMAAAVAALAADGPCEVVGADACAVSYRNFFDDLRHVTGSDSDRID